MKEQWAAFPDTDGDGSWEVTYDLDGRSVVIAYGLTERNARIIAAAPALYSIARFLDCVDWDNFTEHDELLLQSVKEDAQKVVAKIEEARPALVGRCLPQN